MSKDQVALLLIGYQNDYFASNGALHPVVEDGVRKNRVLDHTIELIRSTHQAGGLVINLPILFSPEYDELNNPTGVLKMLKDHGAFIRGTEGGKIIPEFSEFEDYMLDLYGKTGFNSFLGTNLDEKLQEKNISEVAIAGVITSLCIDSTGRAALDRGYKVTVLSDASSGRSDMEHSFYCNDIFPSYGQVETVSEFIHRQAA